MPLASDSDANGHADSYTDVHTDGYTDRHLYTYSVAHAVPIAFGYGLSGEASTGLCRAAHRRQFDQPSAGLARQASATAKPDDG